MLSFSTVVLFSADDSLELMIDGGDVFCSVGVMVIAALVVVVIADSVCCREGINGCEKP